VFLHPSFHNSPNMTILTLFRTKFNNLLTIYGPQEIPKWHPLFNTKCWRCGFYKRKLILYDMTVVTIVIYRFYSPIHKKTYSLLPFFIQRYERHINSVIEDVLKEYFLKGVPIERLAVTPAPSPWTIRRWVNRFQERFEDLRTRVEQFLVTHRQQYQSQKILNHSFQHKLQDLFQKSELLSIRSEDIFRYSILSYLLYTAAITKPQV